MCGIFAYTGSKGKDAAPILLEGLSALEYRGYDSAGLFLPGAGGAKAIGAVKELKDVIPGGYSGHSGIAHLRWATHGEPNEANAHPHADCTKDIWLVHNGIIENYKELKKDLENQGHTFSSSTDTEVLAHLIERELLKKDDFEEAVFSALTQVRGTYGLAVQYGKEPDKLIAARMGSPIVLGIGDGERLIASDPSPILKYTKDLVFLNDGEVAVLTPSSHEVYTLNKEKIERKLETVDWSAEEAQKGGHEHFMLKEMLEEPEVVENSLRGRLVADEGRAKLGGLESVAEELKRVDRIIVVGCGTAYFAGLVGEYMLEGYAGIPVEVELASEFRYRKPVVNERTAVLAISQSGETADTLGAIREAKARGALTLGIVNAVGSTIARETDAGVYNHAGPEIGVASTKAFVSQLTVLALLTLFLGRQRGMREEDGRRIAEELASIPKKLASILARKEEVRALAKRYAHVRDFLYIGRAYSAPIAFEGALKLKEISYIHAEGCSAGEMKHGTIALISEEFPTFAVVPRDSVHEKTLSNIEEIRARRGPVIVLATEGDEKAAALAADTFFVPQTHEMLSPILSVLPLQLFAYYVACERGVNPDRPRNLAKSVTVE